MSQVTITRTYATGGQMSASNYNDDRTEIVAGVNSINDSQVASGADISPSKILGTAATLTGTETLTNKTLTAPTIATITNGGTVTVPSGTVTLASLSGTETLTNKTITSPSIGGTVAGSATYTKPTLNGSVQAIATASDGSTVTFDLSAANIQQVTLAGNRTLALSNGSVGQVFVVNLIQDGTGTRTVTFWSTIKWAGGTTPTLTTTASKIDSFGFITVSSGNYLGFVIGQNL